LGEAGKALEEYEKKGDLHVYAKKELCCINKKQEKKWKKSSEKSIR
jgi:hypothetical protein